MNNDKCERCGGDLNEIEALAWVIDLGYGKWMARCGNEVCNLTNLAEAK